MKSGQSLICPSPENGVCPLFGGTKCYPTKAVCDEGKNWSSYISYLQALVLYQVIDFVLVVLLLVTVYTRDSLIKSYSLVTSHEL